MTNTATMPIRLHAAGVAGPGEDWWDRFFPEDLPQEWQLEYYTHYHSRLLLPGVVWATAEPPFGDWAEAVPSALRLTLEWPADLAPQAGAEQVRVLAQAIGDRLQAVAPCPMGPEGVAAIRAAMESVGLGRVHVYEAGESRPLASAEAAWFYPPGLNDQGGAWQVEPQADLDAPGWRALVEALSQAGGTGETLVFLRARPERLSDFRTIAALLGVG